MITSNCTEHQIKNANQIIIVTEYNLDNIFLKNRQEWQ